MHTSTLDILLPITLLLAQFLLLLYISVFILKRLRLLKTPYSGMEYSEMILIGSLLLSFFIISTSDTEGLFQAFKTFENQNQFVFKNTFSKFSQFFLIILLFECLFAIVSLLIIKLILGFKNGIQDIQEGNVPTALLISFIILSFSLTDYFAAKEIIASYTPQYINFR